MHELTDSSYFSGATGALKDGTWALEGVQHHGGYSQSTLHMENWGLAPSCTHVYLISDLRLPSFHREQTPDLSNTSCNMHFSLWQESHTL